MITIQEYNRRVQENTSEYLQQLLTDSFDLKKFHGVDILAGTVSRCKLSKKSHDILAAIILGFLPFLLENTGTDAISLENGIFVPVECKTSYTNTEKLFKSDRSTIYYTKDITQWADKVPRNKCTPLKSCFNAAYKITNNIALKGVDTYLLCIDELNDSVISIFKINADIITEYFTTRFVPESGLITIKQVTFEKLGRPVSQAIIPIIGFDNWKNSLLNKLPIKNTIK